MWFKNRDYLLVKISNGFQRVLCTQTWFPWHQNIFYSPQPMLIIRCIWKTENHVPRTLDIVSYKVRQAVLWMTPVYTSQVWSQDVNTNPKVGSERKTETKKGEGKWIRWLSHQQATNLLPLLVTKGKQRMETKVTSIDAFSLVPSSEISQDQKTYLKKTKTALGTHLC